MQLMRIVYHYHPPPRPAADPEGITMQRTTRQRLAISAVLRSARRPLSPQEVLEQSRVAGRAIGLATVYRNLKRLVAEGSVHAINLPGDAPRYEASTLAHHHHFQCTRCNRVYDVQGCPGDLRRLAPRGFTVEHHDVTLYGRCSDCGKRQARVRP
jgi:Fur family transcriptional regulator, ferric uptake regulator